MESEHLKCLPNILANDIINRNNNQQILNLLTEYFGLNNLSINVKTNQIYQCEV